jgi:outer membrane receptor protein involved in Fe transport
MSVHRSKFYGRLLCGAAAVSLLTAAGAHAAEDQTQFDIAPQPLSSALNEFATQSKMAVLFTPDLTGARLSPGLSKTAEPETALAMMLQGTGLAWKRNGDTFVIVSASDPQSGSAAGDGAEGTVQALIVTAQKREENIQDVPIAMSAFTQEDLTRSQVAGGPDLMTQVPNFTFTKTNFTGYSIQIRGIGTQAISATTDAAVAVAFNNTPFIRNRFFEQEFYDLQRVEVLRGPQGTLYGRNATAGVVNLISEKPKFAYESRLSLDVSNFSSHRLEGMINIPLVEDKVALRLAGAWTKRDGYDTNQISGNQIDGRDLWSTRLSLRVAPTDGINANLIWEHFQENDDRLRSGKQLCHQDDRETISGLTVHQGALYSDIYSQGCIPSSLYSPDAFEAPNGYSLPYFLPLIGNFQLPATLGFNPYVSLVQSRDLRAIESTVDPKYHAKSDAVELQWTADLGKALTLTSETAYLYDTIFSSEDYNRFNTASGAFDASLNSGGNSNIWAHRDILSAGPNGGVFCDPQIGCADRLVAVDVSRAKSSQFSQEFRLSSDYDGPFNFSLGANFLRYDTEDKYYVFINTLTMAAAIGGLFNPAQNLRPWQPGVSDNSECLHNGFVPADPTTYQLVTGCIYIDPNPIESVNDQGHNYFLSKNPYKLISYAVFGEAYYNITDTLKVTAGLRWTVDKKEAPRIPSMLLATETVGYPVLAVERQEWREPTGRLAIDWKPDLAFTDQTLLYASYSHGYKAGGSNPPPSVIVTYQGSGGQAKVDESVAKPKTFDPEFVNAYEVGAKNTLLDGRVTLNLAAFYYDYKGYQVSQIIDRSAVNYNFDSKIWGAEIEADWRPLENLRLGFKGGYEHTRVADGERAIDIMDRTAGHDDWMVIRPFPTFPSNCILPKAVFDNGYNNLTNIPYPEFVNGFLGPCEYAYINGVDPVTWLPYVENPTTRLTGPPGFTTDTVPLATADVSAQQRYLNYAGFDPATAPNNGEGFFKELGGNELPNAPHFTATVTADYTVPLPSEWLMTLHTDLYYQSEAWTRVFNMPGYDKLKAYTNVNVAAIFSNEGAGWKVMAYVKNVFDKDNITGAFLNSDDTGLTTNVFLNEPRLYGLRVTKEWSGGPWWTGANPGSTGPFPLTVELSGEVLRQDAPYRTIAPPIAGPLAESPQNRGLDWGDGREVKLTYRPGVGPWSIMGSLRYGRSNSSVPLNHAEAPSGPKQCNVLRDTKYGDFFCGSSSPYYSQTYVTGTNWSDSWGSEKEQHEIADFAVGRDVGLGMLGNSHSTVSAGLRYASFESSTRATSHGVNRVLVDGWAKYPSLEEEYRFDLIAQREFKGFGPTLSWAAAQRLVGNEQAGHLDLDWSLTGGVLFGKQATSTAGLYSALSTEGLYTYQRLCSLGSCPSRPVLPTLPLGVADRSKSVSVPMIDLSLGLAYEVGRFKAGAGYRWERYFNVLDVGYDEHKDADRTIDGPYFKVAVGFGG